MKNVSDVPKAEEHEVVPVGGYEPMAGEWYTVRQDELTRRPEELLMQVTVQGDHFSAEAEGRNVRFSCRASHRTCAGTWSDSGGRGRVVLTFGLDFRSFTGTYDGTRQGQDVGRTSWTGTRR